jgi:ABC-type sugar transport system substrate-binding protein
MHRLVLVTLLITALALLSAAPALAAQCPKLIAQINAAAGNRFDAAAYDARVKAAEAQKLHNEGKHPESEKAANEGLARLGIKK